MQCIHRAHAAAASGTLVRRSVGYKHVSSPISCRRWVRSSPFINAASSSATASGSDYGEEVVARKAEVNAWISTWKAKQNGATSEQNGAPSETAVAAAETAPSNLVVDVVKLLVPLSVLYAADLALAVSFKSAAITFPSPIVGMALVLVLLCAMGDKAADKTLAFFMPALNWIGRWLPLFYVASLVTLPLALTGIAGADLAKLIVILVAGMVGTLLFTSKTAVFIREVVKTPMVPIPPAPPSAAFSATHQLAWAAIFFASLLATIVKPQQLGAQMALPLGLAATVGGFLVGNAIPKSLHGLLHPVVVCALVANIGVWLHGQAMAWSYEEGLRVYFSKGAGAMGAGDLLMKMLGVVIVSFGFRIYQQRMTMKRHAPEILGATFLSSLFSMFTAAFAGRALGLAPDLARAIVPRSVTLALALPIASQLDAPLAITAAGILFQAVLGANFGASLMSAAGVKDPIARGLAAAATAGGLGTASLSSKEPETLPFCALSYSMVGVLSTLIAAVPAVRHALIAIIGG